RRVRPTSGYARPPPPSNLQMKDRTRETVLLPAAQGSPWRKFPQAQALSTLARPFRPIPEPEDQKQVAPETVDAPAGEQRAPSRRWGAGPKGGRRRPLGELPPLAPRTPGDIIMRGRELEGSNSSQCSSPTEWRVV